MNLLMLTKYYPFGTGEAFIENEIKVMSEYYEQIVIVACEVPNNSHSVRKLPENVKAYKIVESNKKKNALMGCVKSALRGECYKTEMKKCDTIIKKAFLAYFEEKSQDIFKKITSQSLLNEIHDKEYVLYSYWLFTTARIGVLIANEIPPARMITRAHRYDLYEEKNKTNYLPYRELFLEMYDDIFPCSDNGTQYLKTRFPRYSNKIRTSFLGTLDHGVGKQSIDGVFRIVSCSRVEPVKRVDKIIDALKLLDKKNIDIEWTHIGDGSDFEKLKEKANASLKKIKYCFCGNLTNENVMNLYTNNPFDLFVNVSSSEGLPVSIMEAISFGIPCIGTDVGGTSEIVIDDITGKLIPSEFSTEELASTIEGFITSDKKSARRKACRKLWEKRFQAIPNYRNLYEYLLNIQHVDSSDAR